MARTTTVPLTEAEAGSQYFDFVAHYALTMLSMGTETYEGDVEPPAFRAWADRALRFLGLVKA
jgi:hypothetical protein